jgi:hypothetical protein
MIKAQARAFNHFLKRRQTRKRAPNNSKTYQELVFRVRTTGGGRAPSMAKAGGCRGWVGSPLSSSGGSAPTQKMSSDPMNAGRKKQQPVQFRTACQCGARTRSGNPCRSKRAAVDYTVVQAVAAALLTRWPDMNLAMFGGSAFRMPDRSHDDGDRISNGWQPCRPTI